MKNIFLLLGVAALAASEAENDCRRSQARLSDTKLRKCIAASAAADVDVPIVTDSDQLLLYPEVLWRTSALGFTACCQREVVVDKNLQANPLEDLVVSSASLRDQPEVRFMTPRSSNLSSADKTILLTIALLDVRPAISEDGSSTRPVVRWLLEDIAAMNVSNGTEVLKYSAPIGDGFHKLLVYRQRNGTKQTEASAYGKACTGRAEEEGARCNFNWDRLVSDNELQLLGVNWIKTTSDRFTWFKRSEWLPRAEVCRAENGFGPVAVVAGQEACSTFCHPNTITNNDGSPITGSLELCLTAIKTEGAARTSFIKPNFIEGLLDITWKTSDWKYSVCCVDKFAQGSVTKLNPLSRQEVDGTRMRARPEVKVLAGAGKTIGAADGQLYTIALIDVGNEYDTDDELATPTKPFLHWLAGNIEGLDAEKVPDFVEYVPPFTNHTHVFLLMRQLKGTVFPSADEYATKSPAVCAAGSPLAGRCRFDLTKMMAENSLRVVASSWVKSSNGNFTNWMRINKLDESVSDVCTSSDYTDVNSLSDRPICQSDCSYDMLKSPSTLPDQGIKRCLRSLTKEASDINSNLVSPSADLAVFVDASWNPQKQTFSICCLEDVQPDAPFTRVNPLEHPRIDGVVMKNRPNVAFFTSGDGGYAVGDSNYYTLALYDATPTDAQYGTAAKPFAHWIKYNIRGLDLRSGRELVRWTPPHDNHTYVFVLYKQTRSMYARSRSYGSRSCYPSSRTRYSCLWDEKKFRENQELTVIGTSFLNSTISNYTFYARKSLLRLPEGPVCDVEQFNVPVVNGKLECVNVCDRENRNRTGGLRTCLDSINEYAANQVPGILSQKEALGVFLNVRHASGELSTEYCCRHLQSPATELTVNPLDDTLHEGWALRNMPEINFTSDSPDDYAPGDSNLYTLVLFDATPEPPFGDDDRPYVHYLRVDMKGMDVKTGRVLLDYQAPSQSSDYSWVLYRQERGTLGKIYTDLQYFRNEPGTCFGQQGCMFKWRRFVADNYLDTIGISWIKVKQSPFTSLSALETASAEEVCRDDGPFGDDLFAPTFDSKAVCPDMCNVSKFSESPDRLKACLGGVTTGGRHESAYVHEDDEMEVFLQARWKTELQKYTACCDQHENLGSTVEVNPLDPRRYYSNNLRTKPTFTFYPKSGSGISVGDSNLYTLVFLDISGESPYEVFTPDEGFLHWMVINIPGLNVSAGEEVVSYFSPIVEHKHMIFLFKQNSGRISASNFDPKSFAGLECFEGMEGRCPYHLDALRKSQDMDLVGTTWVSVVQTEYLNYVLSQTQPAALACQPPDDLADGFNTASIVAGDLVCATDCSEEALKVMSSREKCMKAVGVGVARRSEFVDFDEAADLKVYLKLSWTADGWSYSVCCTRRNTIPTRDFLNPLANLEYSGERVRKRPTVEVLPSSDYAPTKGDLFTLALIDSDPLKGEDQTQSRLFPRVEWLVVNIPDSMDVNQGQQAVTYGGLHRNHNYTFLFYKQGRGQIPNKLDSFSGADCLPQGSNRCAWNFKDFISSHNLTLLGTSWLHGVNDIYTYWYRARQLGLPEGFVCTPELFNGTYDQYGRAICPADIGDRAACSLDSNYPETCSYRVPGSRNACGGKSRSKLCYREKSQQPTQCWWQAENIDCGVQQGPWVFRADTLAGAYVYLCDPKESSGAFTSSGQQLVPCANPGKPTLLDDLGVPLNSPDSLPEFLADNALFK